MFEEPELHVIRFAPDPEWRAERDRQQAESRRRYHGELALTLIELGLNAGDVAAWTDAVLDRLFVVGHEGGDPCACSCHPRLPTSDLHDYGFSCSCRLTAAERRQRADEWLAELAASRNSPEAAAQRARRQVEENELASWLAGQPDVVVSSYGGWAPEQWTGSVAGHRFYFRERHDCWRIELDLQPSGRFTQVWTGGDADDDDRVREIEEGEVIAEGVVDVPGYGSSPVERAEFITQAIRDHLTRTVCTLHLTGLADLERHLGWRPDWCPRCGVRLR